MKMAFLWRVCGVSLAVVVVLGQIGVAQTQPTATKAKSSGEGKPIDGGVDAGRAEDAGGARRRTSMRRG